MSYLFIFNFFIIFQALLSASLRVDGLKAVGAFCLIFLSFPRLRFQLRRTLPALTVSAIAKAENDKEVILMKVLVMSQLACTKLFENNVTDEKESLYERIC